MRRLDPVQTESASLIGRVLPGIREQTDRDE